MASSINFDLAELYQKAENAETLSDDAMNFSIESSDGIDEVQRNLDEMENEIFDTNVVGNAILDHFNIEHRRITNTRNNVKGLTKELYGKEYNDKEAFIKMIKKLFRSIEDDLLVQWVEEELE